MKCGYKKDVGRSFLLIPRVKALGLPDLSREAVGQPTYDYMVRTTPRRRDEQAVDSQYNQLWALPLHYLLISRESVLSFHTRRQRLENAFCMSFLPSSLGGLLPQRALSLLLGNGKDNNSLRNSEKFL